MPLTFVLAPDSFKESMSAEQACQAMQRGIQNVLPDALCIHVAMADGGEGTVDTLISSSEVQRIPCEVAGPRPDQRIQTYFGVIDALKSAIIDMANANGIDLLEAARGNPLLTSSCCTGEMLKSAFDLEASEVIIGLGGS